MMILASPLLLLLIVSHSSPVLANDNGLALTPPQGWRSWYLYFSDVDQTLMQKIMDGMVSRSHNDHLGNPTSLCDLGYCDVGLDDNWQLCGSPEAEEGMHYHREDGSPIVNLGRFPDLSGMVDYAHSLNLTAGWYGNNCICSDHCRSKEECDKQTWEDVMALVEFGFDSWKLDGCGGQLDLPLFDKYIRELSTKPILVENCHWGSPNIPYYKPDRSLPPAEGCPWGFYRSSNDISNDNSLSYARILENLHSVEYFRGLNLSYPGCWAYPDILQVGIARGSPSQALSDAETRSHFGGWCIVSSPLILGHDVTNADIADAIWDVIGNREAINVNQAYAGDSGGVYDKSEAVYYLASKEGEEEVTVPEYQYFSKPLGGGRVAVLLMNSGEDPKQLNATFRDVPGLGCPGEDNECSCGVRDIWAHADLGVFNESYAVEVGSHDAAFFILERSSTYATEGGIRGSEKLMDDTKQESLS